jgi:outer membrane protein
MRTFVRGMAAVALGASGAAAWAQGSADALSLAEAVALARARNGTIRAALLDWEAARSRRRESFAAFLPTVTPSFRYVTDRSEVFTGPGRGRAGSSDPIAEIAANWRLLDSGEREWSYQASRRLEEAAAASSSQILRNVLFAVHQQFYDALRSQELLRVSSAQVDRAQRIVDQTQAQIEVGAAPRKDMLQVRSDYLNAQVSKLTAENQTAITEANLKATIGLDTTDRLQALERPAVPQAFAEPAALEEIAREGLANRPDLIALRKRRDAQELFVRSADRRAGFTWSLDTSYSRGFSPDVSDFASASFLVSYPLFDGRRLKEQAKQEKLSLQAQEAELTQAERDARAEIESAHALLRQDVQRVNAAKLAVEAAQLNYEAALESQRLGAEGADVITVLTAQVSLVTAELNFVEALYDYFISDVRLKLVTGRPIPGEQA